MSEPKVTILDFDHFHMQIWDETVQFCMVCGF